MLHHILGKDSYILRSYEICTTIYYQLSLRKKYMMILYTSQTVTINLCRSHSKIYFFQKALLLCTMLNMHTPLYQLNSNVVPIYTQCNFTPCQKYACIKNYLYYKENLINMRLRFDKNIIVFFNPVTI